MQQHGLGQHEPTDEEPFTVAARPCQHDGIAAEPDQQAEGEREEERGEERGEEAEPDDPGQRPHVAEAGCEAREERRLIDAATVGAEARRPPIAVEEEPTLAEGIGAHGAPAGVMQHHRARAARLHHDALRPVVTRVVLVQPDRSSRGGEVVAAIVGRWEQRAVGELLEDVVRSGAGRIGVDGRDAAEVGLPLHALHAERRRDPLRHVAIGEDESGGRGHEQGGSIGGVRGPDPRHGQRQRGEPHQPLDDEHAEDERDGQQHSVERREAGERAQGGPAIGVHAEIVRADGCAVHARTKSP